MIFLGGGQTEEKWKNGDSVHWNIAFALGRSRSYLIIDQRSYLDRLTTLIYLSRLNLLKTIDPIYSIIISGIESLLSSI